MSFFDVFEVDERAVQRTLEDLRVRFPDAVLDAVLEDGVVVVVGSVRTAIDRRTVLDAFRNINPGLTPVVGGGLSVRETAPAPSRGGAGPDPLHLMTRLEELSRRTTQRIYRVQRGDTLRDIAIKFYSDPKAIRILCASNSEHLGSPKDVEPGTMLTVPEALYHRVEPGETLETLAVKYYRDSTMRSVLARANPEVAENREKIRPGQSIRIPLRTPSKNDAQPSVD